MRALLGDLFPGLCSCCVCLPETLEWPILWASSAIHLTNPGELPAAQAPLGCHWYEWQRAQALWPAVCSAGWFSHTVYVLEEICCKKNKNK